MEILSGDRLLLQYTLPTQFLFKTRDIHYGLTAEMRISIQNRPPGLSGALLGPPGLSWLRALLAIEIRIFAESP
jgi:hypothetical protein